jgi:hypothetical protein
MSTQTFLVIGATGKLYYAPASPNSRRVRMLIAEKEFPWRLSLSIWRRASSTAMPISRSIRYSRRVVPTVMRYLEITSRSWSGPV